jgi:hypothetical protein
MPHVYVAAGLPELLYRRLLGLHLPRDQHKTEGTADTDGQSIHHTLLSIVVMVLSKTAFSMAQLYFSLFFGQPSHLQGRQI